MALATSAHQTLDRLGLEWIVSMTPLGNAVSTGEALVTLAPRRAA